MRLTRLELTNFRNIAECCFEPGQKINVLYGCNGSGKTSILEAIYYLSLGRSFRTRNLSRVISHQQRGFVLYSQLLHPEIGAVSVGMERTLSNQHVTKLAGKTITSLVEVAKLLPIQLINTSSHLLLSSGPAERRQFLDWGVFHVEPLFYSYWQRAQRIIKQRNSGLKLANTYNDVKLWDEELEVYANKMHECRKRYICELMTPFYEIAESLLERSDFKLDYHRGWHADKPLKEILQAAFQRDTQIGYTQYGPQRADLLLTINDVPIVDVFSQGQQKLIAYALKLAQGKLMKTSPAKNCIFLIDDLPSELDKHKRYLVAQILESLQTQVFVTGVDAESLSSVLDLSNAKMFHVEQGRIDSSI